MNAWKKTLIVPDATILKAMRTVETSKHKVGLVVDEDMRLLGTLTDGDMRRAILKGLTLETEVERIMNRNFTSAGVNDDPASIFLLMKEKRLRHIPLLNKSGCVVGMKILSDFVKTKECDNWVVIMAGGLGTRLRPLTATHPKALLPIGEKPILEIILKNFIESGFWNFFISVNYKSNMIEEYFGDGSRWGVVIKYLREKRRMGTAGALSLIDEKPAVPVIVMNGDLITKIDFKQLLDYHVENRCSATMCVREYDFQVPYGVVKVDDYRLSRLEEKPVKKFFINAGIYVLEPECLDLIPKKKYFDMTNLFEKIMAQDERPAVYPIREYWVDIGQKEDYDRANGGYGKMKQDGWEDLNIYFGEE